MDICVESSPEYAVSTRKRAAAASLSFKTPTAARTVVNRGGKGKGSVRDSNGVGSSEKSGKHGNTSSKFNGRAKARGAPPALEDINSDEDSDYDPPGEENVTELPEKVLQCSFFYFSPVNRIMNVTFCVLVLAELRTTNQATFY